MPTPRQILIHRFKTQVAIAEAAGCTRQCINMAFKRGRLSSQVAFILAKRMRIPVSSLMTEWVPDTNRRAKQTVSAKKRINAIAPRVQP